MKTLNIVSNIILFYGNLVYYISLVMYKFCNLIIDYIPDNIVPKFLYKSSFEQIKITNVQYCKIIKKNKDISIKNITNKANFILNTFLLKYDKNNSQMSFILTDFIKFIGDCSIIYIDYQLMNQNNKYSSEQGMEKLPNENKKINKKQNEDRGASCKDEEEYLFDILNSSYFREMCDNKENKIKKIIDVRDSNNCKYIDKNNNRINIPFNEIIF